MLNGEDRELALKSVVEREIQKIRKTAAAAAVKLGFGPGKGRLDAVYLEYEWWTGQRLNLAQAARVRCLEALDAILSPSSINGMGTDWIRQLDRSSAVLRRDVIKAAPRGPGRSVLQAYKKEQRAAKEAAYQRGLEEGKRMMAPCAVAA